MKRYQKFEFLLYINENIICQRYFSVNNFNPSSIRSVDIHELNYEVVDMIKATLKEKAKDYLWKYYNPYIPQKPEDVPNRNVFEKEDFFDFEIRIDNRTISKTRFSANFYPPKVKYSVDIRKIISKIIAKIEEGLSLEKYEKSYLDYRL